MTHDPIIISITFSIYFIIVLLIGWYAYQRTRDLSDFILGGRRLGSGVAALSASASDMSGWLLLGLPGFAYAAGLESIWLAGGLLFGTWLNWMVVAARLRVFSYAYGNALTLPEYFSNRFADTSGLLRGIAAVFILLFFLIYTASGLVAGGKLFESVFGLPYIWAVAIAVLSIIVYTAIGGFLAVSWTDVMQGLLMAAALIAVPLLAISLAGGGNSAIDQLNALNPELLDPMTKIDGTAIGWIGIVSLAAWGLGYFGQPHVLARFQAIASPRMVPTARRIAVTWVALTLIGATLTGLTGIIALDAPLLDDARETVFIVMVNTLFHPVIAGILLAAILAAIMSTADSQLLVSSSAFTEDVYRTLMRREASERELVMIGRAAVVSIALFAFALATDPDAMVLDLVAYAWAGFGAAFGAPLVFSLYWRRMTRHGALAGIVVGGLTVVVWKQLDGGLFALYEIVPGMLFSALAIVVVSLLDRQGQARLGERFDEVREQLRVEMRG
ncbi:sodium/proline symporter PutP [Marichromatium bheemlicum]|uniref:Sodium/proline symporter n=1 Tax=Marichromatium bheemlicum TaxID=365339 RepID=A0ABX1I8R4_9GAMM|nr:sodium/proline symporter PutP [Marichromatium bheemlicum]NKN32595.1 sodium/proline symporter PutP [Marichromatium bheemlicum]